MAITYLYPTESDATVPMKPWKHGGGMGISQRRWEVKLKDYQRFEYD